MPLYTPPVPPGTIIPYGGPNPQIFPAPAGWLECSGSAVSRTTYSALFAAIVPKVATVTITIASPGVLTFTAVGGSTLQNMPQGDQVFLTTTGALPTGLSANTLYYAITVSSTTIELATSRANAYVPTPINTSGTQSGTHSLWYCPYGLGDGSTTFNVPDSHGRALFGDDMTVGRLSLGGTGGSYGNQGATGGEQIHSLTTAEGPSHTHVLNKNSTAGGDGSGYAWASTTASNSAGVATSGSNTGHNTVPPAIVVSYLIKT